MNVRVDKVKLTTEIARADTTIKVVAEKAGLHRGTVSVIKGGKSCKRETAQKIAAALDVPLEAILQEA